MDCYQDYAIKDGKFVGKFEKMDRKLDDPWHLSEEKNNQISYANLVRPAQPRKDHGRAAGDGGDGRARDERRLQIVLK